MSPSPTPRGLRTAAACLTLLAAPALLAQGAALEQRLTPGRVLHGFRAAAVYLNDADRPMGARFIHARTGFVFDALRLESVPQGYIWVNSFPTSDMGEPHTQDHPLAYVSGGSPEALRVIRPEHIRAFHKAHYQLSNMGMVGSFPEEMPLDSVLARLDASLVRLQGKAPAAKPVMTEATLPAPKPSAP